MTCVIQHAAYTAPYPRQCGNFKNKIIAEPCNPMDPYNSRYHCQGVQLVHTLLTLEIFKKEF